VQRPRVWLVDRQVITEDSSGQHLSESGLLQLASNDASVPCRHETKRVTGRAQSPQRIDRARKGLPEVLRVEGLEPALAGLLELVDGDAEPLVHEPPVGVVVLAVERLVERQAETTEDVTVGAENLAEGIDEGAVPVEDKCLHDRIVVLGRMASRSSASDLGARPQERVTDRLA
jgi:hypothetical protein